MDLAAQLANILAEYCEEVNEEVDKIAEQVAKETVKELREISPKRTGKYSKGWRKKRVRNGVWVVYSFTDLLLIYLNLDILNEMGGGLRRTLI